jgi:hypothetical protein
MIRRSKKLPDWRVVRAACTEKKNAPKAILSAEKSWWFEMQAFPLGAALRYVLRTTQGPAPRDIF